MRGAVLGWPGTIGGDRRRDGVGGRLHRGRGPPVTTHRMWLDSADFRLYRSGMALMVTAGPDGDEHGLELSGSDGETVTVGSDTLGWPRLLACLPHQLRPRLEPVLGVRALLPVVRESGTSVGGRLLDGEGKTVCASSMSVRVSGSRGRLSAGLRLIPLRGYAAVAARAGGIAHGPGWCVSTGPATRRHCALRGSTPMRPVRRWSRGCLPAWRSPGCWSPSSTRWRPPGTAP